MGLLPCPNLPLWPAEKSFSSTDENHFPLRKKKKRGKKGFLSCSLFPSKSPSNYAADRADLPWGHCCRNLLWFGHTDAQTSPLHLRVTMRNLHTVRPTKYFIHSTKLCVTRGGSVSVAVLCLGSKSRAEAAVWFRETAGLKKR